jgi:Asp/Glu/hydantoin racemase
MTDALQPLITTLLPSYPNLKVTYFTCPSGDGTGIPSINSPADARHSAAVCLPHLLPLIPEYDLFLVACYSQHPLVGQLKRACVGVGTSAGTTSAGTSSGGKGRKYVTGIFEASVLAAMGLIDPDVDVAPDPDEHEHERDASTTPTPPQGFGIVSTGSIWSEALADAVDEFFLLNTRHGKEKGTGNASSRFYGCETTGLNADQLHVLPAAEVRVKMMEATARLLKKGMQSQSQGKSSVKAICLGCAGMVGLEEAVRTACVEVLGEEGGKEVVIVDGVKAGVGVLYGLARAGF